MIRTVIGLGLGALILKKVSPDTYNKTVNILSDSIDTVSDITTAVRGETKAISCEIAKDANEKLAVVDPKAVESLRALL